MYDRTFNPELMKHELRIKREEKSPPMNITMKDIKELERNVREYDVCKKAAEATSNPEASDSCLKQANYYANKVCEIWQRVFLNQ